MWIAKNDLAGHLKKTDAVILKGSRKRENLDFKIGDTKINPRKELLQREKP